MTPWRPWTRFAFRFAFVYFVIYLLPFPLESIPKLDVAAERYSEFWQKAVPWVGRNIVRLENEVSVAPSGSGDTTFNWVQLLCFFAIALVLAAIWSLVDRNRKAYPRLLDWLRIYVRFALGLTMFGYGMAKVICTQFPSPELDRYIQPVGHLSPMGLLWTFMGASQTYCGFTGLAECIGGLLLFWRRTTTVGALIVGGVMLNVAMLNFCYDVPVKQFSAHLVIMALFLLAPDIGRLLDFFFLNRATAARVLGRPFANRWLNRAALAFKVLFLGWTLGYAVKDAWDLASNLAAAPRPALYGIYEVESFARAGEPEPRPSDEKRWRRVVVNRSGRLAVQLGDDSVQRFFVKDNAEEGKLELVPRWEPEKKSVLAYTKQDEDRLLIEGDFFGENVQITLHKLPDPKFLLPSRGFHWINEQPFNR